jgi:uncharacterized protein
MAVAERESQQSSDPGAPRRLKRIDTDTHQYTLEPQLRPYLSERWRNYVDTYGLRQAHAPGAIVGAHLLAARTDAWGPEGQLPGTNPKFFCEQLLDTYDLDIAVLNSMQMQNPMWFGPVGMPWQMLAEFARAGNMYTQEVWLDADPRLRGAICTHFENPTEAVKEIERCAQDRRFVQILLPFRTIDPIGHQKYWPMLEICEHYRLPISLHPALQHISTGAGQQSVYYEHHTALPSALPVQMTSLLVEGVFDRFPNLQILFQEGGWSWVPPMLWRLDHLWSKLRDEVPNLDRKPSEIVRDHIWWTTQPIEEPPTPEIFLEMWDQFCKAGLRNQLMFSSDYPHWDFDAPDAAIPRTMSEEDRDAIFRANPLACYTRLREDDEAAAAAGAL